MAINLLALETSCDDTSVALLQDGNLVNNLTSSQPVHQNYGGIVPELASRAHQKNLIPLLDILLDQSNLQKNSVDAVAFTIGPGLLGSLLTGTLFAKSLALSLDIPLIPVDHLHGHLLSLFINSPVPEYPFLCLLVSGGHTMIIKVKDPLNFEILGRTMDDAAGEAFDKGAKIMGLSYPGGPEIDQRARDGDENRFSFPHPKIKGFNYSFSGLKTNLLYKIRDLSEQDEEFLENNLDDFCASYQKAINVFLVSKLKKAAEHTGIREIAVAGGVAANRGLQNRVKEMTQTLNGNLYIPNLEYCMDNAAMIGMVGWHQYQNGIFGDQKTVPYAKSQLK